MFSIFRNLINKKFWKTTSSKLFGSAYGIFAKVRRGGSSSFAAAKKLYAKAPNVFNTALFTGVGTVTSHLVLRALNRLKPAIEYVADRDEQRFGGPCFDNSAAAAAKTKNHINNLNATLISMLAVNERDKRQRLVVLIQQYHDLINNLEDQYLDLALTTDRVIGDCYTAGVKPEIDKDSDFMFAKLIEIKDDPTTVRSVENSLLAVLLIDSKHIPLQPL